MSGPSTVLVLDTQSPSPAHKYLDASDRLVVVTDSPGLARHALSTMVVDVFVCDLSAQADFKSLATIAQVSSPNVRFLFTGAKLADGVLVTNGGRVTGTTAIAPTLEEAIREAYRLADGVRFENAYRRSDIGARALKALK